MANSQVATMSGAALGSLTQALFGKKKAPAYTPYVEVDAADEARRTIEGNLENFSGIENLISRTNKLNQSERGKMIESAMPGWGAMSRKMTDAYGNVWDGLSSGGMPSDMEANIERLAAERGISAGTRGQFNDFSLLRDFGVNSMDYAQGQAQLFGNMTNALMSVANFSTVAPMMAQSFFVTPEQQIALTSDSHTKNWMGQNQKNQADADAWNWNRQNLVGGIAQGAVYTGAAADSAYNNYINDWGGGFSGFGGSGQSGAGAGAGAGSGLDMSSISGLLSGASGASGAAMFCWVAREVYGAENPRWLQFRDWMLNRAPEWARRVYAKNGPAAAEMVRNRPSLRIEMMRLMDRILELDENGTKLGEI
jgi:hypothetical protein